MKFFEKLSWFFVSFLPTAAFIIIQILSVTAYMFIASLLASVPGADAEFLYNTSFAMLAYQLSGMIVFGAWYFFCWDREDRPKGLARPNAGKLIIIVFSGLLLQVFVSGVLGLLNSMIPDLFEEYNEMMENAGFNVMTPLSFLTTSIAAPIVEELAFRGVTLRIAGKVSSRFWLANCIQALAFGIAHMNPIQGIYAFFLGLALGYVYGKYQNIWVCMLLHGAINLSGFCIEPLMQIVPQQLEFLLPIFFYIIAPLLLFRCYKALGRIEAPKEECSNDLELP